jgi:hypothetical protein
METIQKWKKVGKRSPWKPNKNYKKVGKRSQVNQKRSTSNILFLRCRLIVHYY